MTDKKHANTDSCVWTVFDLDGTLIDDDLNVFTDVPKILESLTKNGYCVAAASFNITIEKILKDVQLYEYFDVVYASREKTKGAMLDKFRENKGIRDPSNVIFFDNRQDNIEDARKHGYTAVWTPNGITDNIRDLPTLASRCQPLPPLFISRLARLLAYMNPLQPYIWMSDAHLLLGRSRIEALKDMPFAFSPETTAKFVDEFPELGVHMVQSTIVDNFLRYTTMPTNLLQLNREKARGLDSTKLTGEQRRLQCLKDRLGLSRIGMNLPINNMKYEDDGPIPFEKYENGNFRKWHSLVFAIHANGDHWCMLVYNFQLDYWVLYDSIANTGMDKANQLLLALKKEKIVDAAPNRLAKHRNSIHCPHIGFPQQKGGWECGYYVLAFYEYICRTKSHIKHEDYPLFTNHLVWRIMNCLNHNMAPESPINSKHTSSSSSSDDDDDDNDDVQELYSKNLSQRLE